MPDERCLVLATAAVAGPTHPCSSPHPTPPHRMLHPHSLQVLVYEKEKRLRMMMKMHGLGNGAYWLVTYCWWVVWVVEVACH